MIPKSGSVISLSRNIAVFLIVILTILITLFYRFSQLCARRAYWEVIQVLQGRMEFYQEQFTELAAYLKEYKQVNNEYPDNNMALSKLSFKGNRCFIYVEFKENEKGLFCISRPDVVSAEREIIEILQNRQKEVLPADPWLYDFGTKREGLEYEQYILTIDNSEVPFILKDEQVVDWWYFLPYLYENRAGFSKTVFGDSFVNDDTHQQFSYRVDDGVYVYSIGAMHYAQELEQNNNCMVLLNRYTNILMVMFILSIVGLTVKMYLSSGRKKILLICTIIAYGAASFVVGHLGKEPLDFMRHHISHLTPAMVQQQKNMLNLYYDNKVINEYNLKKQLKMLKSTSSCDEIQ